MIVAILTFIIGLMVGWFFGLGTCMVGLERGWIKLDKDKKDDEGRYRK